MSSEQLPPLRMREADGSPNVIPVYEIVVSNATLTNLGGGRVGLATGAGSQTVYAPTGGAFLTYQADTSLTDERVIAASNNITIVSSGTSFLISAVTGAPLTLPVQVGSGGTGTTTAFNTGAIVFQTSPTAYGQNANFNFDTGATRLIVGTTLGANQRLVITDGTWFGVGGVTATFQESVGNCIINMFCNTDNRTSEIQFGYPTNASRFSIRTINSSNYAHDIIGFVTGNVYQLGLTVQGSTIQGTGGFIAQAGVDGFLYVRATSGAPSGIPTPFGTSETPFVYDTSNNRLWIYNGSWRGVNLT